MKLKLLTATHFLKAWKMCRIDQESRAIIAKSRQVVVGWVVGCFVFLGFVFLLGAGGAVGVWSDLL